MAYTACTQSTRNVGAALLYQVQKDGQAREGVLRRGYNVDLDHAREDFKAMREANGLKGGVEGYTDIISFPPGEVSKQQALDVACEAYTRAFPNSQYVAALHTDGRGGKLHIHFCRNNIDLATGKRLNSSGMLNHLKECVDEVCRDHGLSVIELKPNPRNKYQSYSVDGAELRYNKTERNMAYQGKASWKDELRQIIESTAATSESAADFKIAMANQGVQVTERAGGYTYRYKDHKAVRGVRLGDDYNKDKLLDRFERNHQERIVGRVVGYDQLNEQDRAQYGRFALRASGGDRDSAKMALGRLRFVQQTDGKHYAAPLPTESYNNKRLRVGADLSRAAISSVVSTATDAVGKVLSMVSKWIDDRNRALDMESRAIAAAQSSLAAYMDAQDRADEYKEMIEEILDKAMIAKSKADDARGLAQSARESAMSMLAEMRSRVRTR